MSVLDSLRKALGYVLLSMGVSRPAPKATPAGSAPEKPDPGNSQAEKS